MEPWNERYIAKPPVISILYTCKEVRQALDYANSSQTESFISVDSKTWVGYLRRTFGNIKNTLVEVEKLFKKECSYLSAYMYQCGKHRPEKFMQALRKVSKCVKRYKERSICPIIDEICDMLPAAKLSEENIRLPSSKCLLHLVSSLMGQFYLLLKIVSSCEESGVYLKSKLQTGHFLAPVTLLMSLVARLRILAANQVTIISNGYDLVAPILIGLIAAKGEDYIDIYSKSLQKELLNMDLKRKETFLEPQRYKHQNRLTDTYDSKIVDSSLDLGTTAAATMEDLGEAVEAAAANPQANLPNSDESDEEIQLPSKILSLKKLKCDSDALNVEIKGMKVNELLCWIEEKKTFLKKGLKIPFSPDLLADDIRVIKLNFTILSKSLSELPPVEKKRILRVYLKIAFLIPQISGTVNTWTENKCLCKIVEHIYSKREIGYLSQLPPDVKLMSSRHSRLRKQKKFTKKTQRRKKKRKN